MEDMPQYSIDIGFNKGLDRHPTDNFAALLSQGVTVVGDDGNPVQVARCLKTPGQLQLTAYDLSEDPTAGEISALSAELLFSSALPTNSDQSPLSQGYALSNFEIFKDAVLGKSTVFGVPQVPRWFIKYKSDGTGFPQNQLQPCTVNGVDPTFDLVNDGYFYYTILLSVTWNDDVQKFFRVDPEMIVTPDIGDSDTVQGSLNCSAKR